MQIDEVRTHLTTLKLYVNKMDEFINQSIKMVHQIEERLMDLEDEIVFKKYQNTKSINSLNEAATQAFGPARQVIDRCNEENTLLAAFVQEFSKINTLTSKRS